MQGLDKSEPEAGQHRGEVHPGRLQASCGEAEIMDNSQECAFGRSVGRSAISPASSSSSSLHRQVNLCLELLVGLSFWPCLLGTTVAQFGTCLFWRTLGSASVQDLFAGTGF